MTITGLTQLLSVILRICEILRFAQNDKITFRSA